jgi:hypothetical protein
LSGERQRHASGGFLILQERDASNGPHYPSRKQGIGRLCERTK